MKTISRIIIFLAAFFIGVAVIRISDGLLEIALPMPNTTKIKTPVSAEKGVKVNFINVRNDDELTFYTVEIENKSSETLTYTGYSKENICSYKIQNNNRIESIPCFCATGLASQELKPNETVRHTVHNPSVKISGKTRLGFNFMVGEKLMTFWTEEFYIPKQKTIIFAGG